MLLTELYDRPTPGYEDPSKDNSVKQSWREARKTKLTLAQLRVLRRMSDVRNFEKMQRIRKIQDQYSPAQSGEQMQGL